MTVLESAYFLNRSLPKNVINSAAYNLYTVQGLMLKAWTCM